MSASFFILALLFAAGLLALLFWSLRRPARRHKRAEESLEVIERAPQHLCNLSSIRQCFDPADAIYVHEKGGTNLARRVRGERKRVALLYLASLRADFEDLLQVARVIARLSPQVSGSQEYDRFRLTVLFRVRFHLLRVQLLFGTLAQPRLNLLGEMVTSLAVEMETAMAELGERAALATELALQSGR